MKSTVELTPHERAGRTRRQRTLEAAVGALEELLVDRPYDEITVGDIVGLANIGTATFYQVVRDKARAAGFAVWWDLEPTLTADLLTRASSSAERALGDLTLELGRYGAEHPGKAHAACRAYDSSMAHRSMEDDPDHPLRRLLSIVEAHLDRAARHGVCPSYVAEPGVAGFVLTQALMAGQSGHVDDWRTRIDRLNHMLQLGELDGEL